MTRKHDALDSAAVRCRITQYCVLPCIMLFLLPSKYNLLCISQRITCLSPQASLPALLYRVLCCCAYWHVLRVHSMQHNLYCYIAIPFITVCCVFGTLWCILGRTSATGQLFGVFGALCVFSAGNLVASICFVVLRLSSLKTHAYVVTHASC